MAEQNNLKNAYTFLVHEQLQVKIWKKRCNGVSVTLSKPGRSQAFTLSLEAFLALLEAQDMILLASDFMRGLVGTSPEDIMAVSQEEEEEVQNQVNENSLNF